MARKCWLSSFEPIVRFVVPCCLLVLAASPAFAQIIPGRLRIARPMGIRIAPGMPAQGGSGTVETALPKIDPESQQLLKRADQFITDERYDLAAILWQKVLDEAGDNMVAVEGDRFVPLRSEVEAAISKSKPEAVAAYRLNADNEVAGLLARVTPDNESEILGQIVRRFFLSENGDDAAFRIGCRALDRGDFVLATRMFLKVLEEHPDPSVSKGDLQLRLAVSAGKLGDLAGADQFLKQVREAAAGGPTRSLVATVSRDLEKKPLGVQSSQQDHWLIAWGSPGRKGAMPSIDPAAYKASLTDKHFAEYSLTFPEPQPMNGAYFGMARQTSNQGPVARPQMIERWKNGNWRPAGTVLFQDGRVYFKTSEDLQCYKAGESLTKPLWRTAWLNAFQVDDQSQWMLMMPMVYGMANNARRSDVPNGPAEVALFGDRVYHSMSIVGNTIFTLEGVRRGRGSDATQIAQQPFQFNYQNVPRRSRVNWLAAYDSRNGKVRWRRNADDEREEKAAETPAAPVEEKVADGPKTEAPGKPLEGPALVPPRAVKPVAGGFGPEAAGASCFMGSPVACGTSLLVPVSDGGTIYLMAMSPEDGKTRWRTHLCDDPASGAAPWSPIGVSVDGQEAYVVCGTGLVFAVDGTTGDIRWASRYRRDQSNVPVAMNPWQQNSLRQFNGWDDDVAIPLGRQVIILASDSDRMFALDRRSGKFIWDSPRTSPFGVEANYYVGTQADRLVVAGTKVARGYDLNSGRLVWEREIERSLGRGCIAGDAVFIPSNDSIIAFDLKSGKERSQVGVSLASASGEPAGNLYSDGQQIWMLSANRLYALTTLASRLEGLKKRIDSGDRAALTERARLLARAREWDPAAADIRELFKQISGQEGYRQAWVDIVTLLGEVEMGQKQPIRAIEFVAEFSKSNEARAAMKNPEVASKISALLMPSMRGLHVAGDVSVAPALIAATEPLEANLALRNQSSRTLGYLANGTIPKWLSELASRETTGARRWAVSIASHVDKKAGGKLLGKLLEDDDAEVRYLAARGLLQLSDRSALAELVKLLESENAALKMGASRTLRAVTRGKVPLDTSATGEQATEQIAAWKKWLDEESETADLKLPYRHDLVLLGRTLVTNAHSRQVIELDESGKELKRLDVEVPISVWATATGQKFVGMMQTNMVVEYDENWNRVWQSEPLPSAPVSIHRGEDDVLVVACADARIVMYLDANKQFRDLYKSQRNPQFRPVSVRRLEGGNTLIGLQGARKVIEVDGKGAIVWEANTGGNDVMGAFRGEDGTTFVLSQGNKILEFDTKGSLLRTINLAAKRAVMSAHPLPGGGFLTTDGQSVTELDSQGKIVWTHNEMNANSAIRY